MLITPDKPCIEVDRRTTGGWTLEVIEQPAVSLELRSVELRIEMAAIYA